MPKERRRSPRIPVEGNVVVYSGNQRLTCRLLNVSESGMALAVDSEQRPGTFLRLRFTLPGDRRPTGVDAVVVRHRGSGSQVEWGIQLVDPPPALSARLRKLEAEELGVVVLPGDESEPPRETGIELIEDSEEEVLAQKLRSLFLKARDKLED